jgi:hypothetical protein
MYQSSNYLVNCYYETNAANGHQYNCAYGAGGDCTCGLYEEYDPDLHEMLPTLPAFALVAKTRKGIHSVGMLYDFERACTEGKRLAVQSGTMVRIVKATTVEEFYALPLMFEDE